jgi:hypothetical protein
MARPQCGLPSLELPDAWPIVRGLAGSGGETGLLCQEEGKKRTARGRKLGTLAQTIAVLTSATDQLIGDTPVSEIQISRRSIEGLGLLTCNVY